MDAGPLKGMDALLSTVQMPAGVPVASVAIGSAGARNAAFLAAQMLALADSGLSERLRAERKSNAESVVAKDRALQKKLQGG
jgi:5-(carboxyamino)imidazole ribonucleotide mutase